jgi:GTP cyclohydrolase I
LAYSQWNFNFFDNVAEPMMTPYDTGETKDITGDQPSSVSAATQRPSRSEAEAAVELLLRWIGDDPTREGLIGTPERVVRAWEEFCVGYSEDPASMLQRTFEEVEGYDDMVMLRNIRMESHCEHHLVPILGLAHIAYLPDRRVVGISKLARVIDSFARRLQTQETLTAQVTETIQSVLQPKGVAILIDAQHQCMTTRGVRKPDVSMITTRFTGVFQTDKDLQRRFLDQARLG